MLENQNTPPEAPEPRSSHNLSSIEDEFDPELDFDIEILETMSFENQMVYMNNISKRRQELHDKKTPPM